METIFDKPLDKQVADNTQAIADLDDKVSYENTITNLNVTEPGTYYYPANSTNAPVTNAGRMIVMKSSESSYGTQIASINSSSTPFVYVRSFGSGSYGSWQELALKSDIPDVATISGGAAQNVSFTLSPPKDCGIIIVRLPQTAAIATAYIYFYAKHNGNVNVFAIDGGSTSITITASGGNVSITTSHQHGCYARAISFQ